MRYFRLLLFMFFVFTGICFAEKPAKIDSILSQNKSYSKVIVELRDLFSDQELQDALNTEESASKKIKLINALCWKNFISDPQKAIEFAKKQMELAVAIHDNDAMEVGFDNFGFLYKNFGDYEKSISYLLKSLKLKEARNDSAGISVCLNGVGGLYYKMERYPEALKYMLRTFKLDSALGNKEKLIIHYGNIGACYANMEQYDKALTYYLLAEHYADSLGEKQSSENLSNTGTAYLKRSQYEKAHEYFFKALKIAEQDNDVNTLSFVYIQVAGLDLIQKKYDEAVKFGEEGLSLAEKNNLNDGILQASNALAEIYSQMGDYKKAFEYQKKYSIVKDTVLTEANTRSITEMQTKYETEKKEKENQVYKQTIQIQELDANKQRIIIYSISALAILFIALAFFILRSYRQKQQANLELSEKNLIIEEKGRIVEEKNKDITDSIRYAKRLQDAILKPVRTLPDVFPESFILFRPKDIVSGDFYWFEKFGNLSMIAAADCTGHGVPGAFMSIIGCNLVSQAVNEYALTKPAVILNSLNKGLSKILHQHMDESSVKDGMDIALCGFNLQKMTVEYAGAFNPMWIVRQRELMEYNGDKFPVGAFVGEELKMFSNHELQLQKGDTVYLFSDGYADQFGGPKGKKFKYKQLKELLISMQDKPMTAQRDVLSARLDEWKGSLDQVDDILIIGVRV